MATKRSHDDEPPSARTRARLALPALLPRIVPPLAPDVTLALTDLPGEMHEEIMTQLMAEAALGSFYLFAEWDPSLRALVAVRGVNHALWRAVSAVLHRTWSVPYETLKQAIRLHDWRRRAPRVFNHIYPMINIMHRLEVSNVISRAAQLGHFNRVHLARVDAATADAVLACLDTQYKLRARAQEDWSNLREDDRTFARLLWFLNPRMDYPTWGVLLPLLMPAWAAVDLDECLAMVALWMDQHSALWEELRYVRPYWVALVLEHKLHVTDAPAMLDKVRKADTGAWDVVSRHLTDYWLYASHTAHFIAAGSIFEFYQQHVMDPEELAFNARILGLLLDT
jgi:hypothetical protein